MVERHQVMLRELLKAISKVNRPYVSESQSREETLAALRFSHTICVKVHMYLEAWCIQGVIMMIDDSPTVRDVLCELRACVGQTPHSNRGVGYVTPLSFSSDEVSNDER